LGCNWLFIGWFFIRVGGDQIGNILKVFKK
jgi:hypothetical protein